MSEKTAPQVEADGDDTLTIDWDGVTVTIPAALEDWDPDALEAFENQRAMSALRGLLGRAGYEQLRRDFAVKHGRKVKVGDLIGLLERVAQEYGFVAQGE
jgi:hypothetical protein